VGKDGLVMTIHMKDFGKFLVTRQTAKSILETVEFDQATTLDFSGVTVANHPFMDELGKGIAAQLSPQDLAAVKITNSNPYIDGCIAAGFTTALAV
jgi:hypothetical protein